MSNTQLNKSTGNKKPPKQIKDTLSDLSAEEIKFTRLVAKGISYTTAYRKAFPHKGHLSYSRIRVLGHQLATKQNIKTEVATVKATQARLARLAEDRIEGILTEDSTKFKGSKVAEVAMFMYDHANGKATQKILTQGQHVLLTYDLSGGQAGTPPKEVLAELEK